MALPNASERLNFFDVSRGRRGWCRVKPLYLFLLFVKCLDHGRYLCVFVLDDVFQLHNFLLQSPEVCIESLGLLLKFIAMACPLALCGAILDGSRRRAALLMPVNDWHLRHAWHSEYLRLRYANVLQGFD